MLCWSVSLIIGLEAVGFFVATLAIEFEADTRCAPLFGEYPITRGQGWIVPDVLPMTAFQNGTPMVFIVLVKVCDLAFHRSLAGARTYPVLVRLPEVGRHQRMIESVIKKQMPDETISGNKTE